MTAQSRSLARLLYVELLFLVPALALAGPNEGGTLILHANPGLVFTSDIQNYCGMSALDSCSAAVTSVEWDPGRKIVFHAIAAFPPESQPRLKALSFGIDYDAAKFVMVARGTCADFEIPGIDWLAPGTGTSQSWTTGAQTGLLTEVYWFAGYTYSEQTPDSTSVSLIPHPLQHGVFVDDGFPSEADTIAGHGRLGFGTTGHLQCPTLTDIVVVVPGGEGDTDGSGDEDGSEGDGPDDGGDSEGAIDPNSYVPRVVLAKIGKAALAFPAGVGSMSLSEATSRGNVVLSDSLANALEEEGVTFITQSIPGFNPTIVDRYGNPVLGSAADTLKVPEDLSLWFELTLNHDDVSGAVSRLTSADEVQEAEPNFVGEVASPNDAYFSPQQWGLHNRAQYCIGIEHFDINALAAWERFGSQIDVPVRVAVLDTGIDFGHPDIPFVEAGINLDSPASPPVDDYSNSHGTAVSGIIGMSTGNLYGGAGVASGATIVPVKVFDANGQLTAERSAQGINWARSEGIKIINMSYTTGNSSWFSVLEQLALRNARAAGMSCVAAAGNYNNDTLPMYPAAHAKHVFTVNAFMPNGLRWQDELLPGGYRPWWGSNYGSYIDMTAPGGDGIMTTKRHTDGNGYYDLTPLDPVNCSNNNWITANGIGGTSMAAPVVSGVIAAVLSRDSGLDGEDAQEIVRRTAIHHDSSGSGWGPESGWGRPNLEAALEMVTVPMQSEHGTAVGGTVTPGGWGECHIIMPGITGGPLVFHRMTVTNTVSLQQSYQGTPVAWGRVQGSIGWRYIQTEEVYDDHAENAGYAEVVGVTATTVTVRTYWYEIYIDLDGYLHHFADLPNDGNVSMSYTAIGSVPSSGVDPAPLSNGTLAAWPNPARAAVWISLRAGAGSSSGRVGVFAASGQSIRQLEVPVEGLEWDMRDEGGHRVPNGVYFVRAHGQRGDHTHKLLVVR